MIGQEPVVTAGSIAGLISAVLVFARLMGWLPLTDEQFNALMAVVVLALPISGSLIARRFVTPTSNPHNDAGERLVPEQSQGQGQG